MARHGWLMITRIELTNFMSHGQTVIEPAAGLTVLVGPNNVGKSAIVAALQILARNDNSTHVMRHGARECSIKVHTDDGHVIEWRRRNSPGYTIDGQTFDRLRQSGLPDELHAVLRLPSVDETVDADLDVHFGAQKSPIFLLASSPASAARFFASSSDAVRLVAMQKRHKDKLTEAQREKRALENESRRLNAELEVLEPVVVLEQLLEQTERAGEELQDANIRLDAATKHVSALARQQQLHVEHLARLTALRPLAPPPALAPTEPLARLIAQTTASARAEREAQTQGTVLAALNPPPVLASTDPLATLIVDLAATERRSTVLAAQTTVLEPLAEPPPIVEIGGLARLVGRLKTVAAAIASAQELSNCLAKLPEPPTLVDRSTLAVLVERLSATTRSYEVLTAQCDVLDRAAEPPALANDEALARLAKDVTVATAQLQTCRQDVLDAERALDACGDALRVSAEGQVCPLCAAPLDPARVVASALAGMRGHDHE